MANASNDPSFEMIIDLSLLTILPWQVDYFAFINLYYVKAL